MSAGYKYLDAGALFGGKFSHLVAQFTAGGGSDNLQTAGIAVDRTGFESGALLIPYTATLAQAATLSFAVDRQESSDGGTTWGTATVLQAATVAATGPTGGGTVRGVVKIRDNFETAELTVRYRITADLSAGATDVASYGAVAVLGGARSLPVP